jgi:hypothetical protein
MAECAQSSFYQTLNQDSVHRHTTYYPESNIFLACPAAISPLTSARVGIADRTTDRNQPNGIDGIMDWAGTSPSTCNCV